MLDMLIEKNGKQRVKGFFANMTDDEINKLGDILAKFNFDYRPEIGNS